MWLYIFSRATLSTSTYTPNKNARQTTHISLTSVTVPLMISKRKPKTFKSFLRYGDALRMSMSSRMDCFILHIYCLQSARDTNNARPVKKKKKKKKTKTYLLIAPNSIASTSFSCSGPPRSLSFILRPSSVIDARPQSGGCRFWSAFYFNATFDFRD